MICKPTLRAVVFLWALTLCGVAAAQDCRYGGRESGGYGGRPGGFERPEVYRGPPGRPDFPSGPYPRALPPIERREPGPPPYGGAPRPHGPSTYPSGPPRRSTADLPGAPPPLLPSGAPRPGPASLGLVLDNIERRTPGRQLDSALDDFDGRQVYRVMWLTRQGRRLDYVVDAETGRILGVR